MAIGINTDIAKLIENMSKRVKDGKISFTKAAEKIGTHPKLSIISLDNLMAVYSLETPQNRTRIIFESFESSQYSPERILSLVSEVSKISPEAIKMPSRKREIAEARHAFFLLMLNLKENDKVKYSLGEIGKIVNRDHSTVLHAKNLEHIHNIQQVYNNAKRLI